MRASLSFIPAIVFRTTVLCLCPNMICCTAAIILPVPPLMQQAPTATSSDHPCFHDVHQVWGLNGAQKELKGHIKGSEDKSETSKKQQDSTWLELFSSSANNF
ncbi:hypothetical protein FOCG_00435 [Fusarium oxysporum f. sp. radicis-lycopersici 26381]|nr:hypothetical protein FOWG_02952 [Fusarium oxysporum f. sp. lycopersici MN25]EXL61247.1 hypothetical protein FOCG_00435 [Fusarium oxysporum f. sp. radicis-lycopersici 26381]